MSQKRFVFFIGALDEGGAERVLSILANELAKRGHEIEVLTYYHREVVYPLNSEIKLSSVEEATDGKRLLGRLLWLRRYFRKNARVAISFLAPFNMLMILATIGTRVPVIVADRNDPRRIPQKALVRRLRNLLYRFADRVVLQTKSNADYFGRAIQKKSEIIFNPIDLGDASGLALRTKKEKKIVSVGRLMPQKNHEMLIRAFASLAKKLPDYRLVIYGEGKNRQNLEALITQLHLEQFVLLPGSVSNVPQAIADAQVFALSSDYEGMSNALMEAMCLGLPVLSTAVSGTSDLIESERNGLLVPVGDESAFTNELLRLTLDPALQKHFGEEAQELTKRCSPEAVCDQWEALLKSVISTMNA